MLKRFSEIRMKDVSICGGKGASLGEMMNAGLPIPNGFVLTTEAYGKDSKERENQVLEAFDKLDTKFVAVRSSGTKEDGVDDSFAGQFDTYLFVTKENLIKKIKECHDSVNSERIVSYCEYKGIDIESIKVAVVVQKMVNSESAGVCFTVNPVSQNPDEIMIDAGYGVGEAVVSGMITPDNYIVNKKTGEIKKNISQQEKKLVLSDKGGTKEVEIAKEEQETQKLSDKHIEELAELAKKIEKHYGKPMDTEWAIENGELFMLQARPITTLGDKIETKRYTIYPAGDFNTSFISNYSVVLGYTKFPKLLGLPICDGPHVVRNGDLEYIFDMSTRDACEKSIVQKMDDDANYIDNLIDKMMEEGKNLCERIKKKSQKSDLKKLKNEELLEILEEFVEYQSNIYAYGTSFNFIGYGEDNYITKNLNKIFREKNISEGKINEVMEIFTYPYKESFSQQQEIEILELLNKYINKYKKDFINDCKNKGLEFIQEKYLDFFEELKLHSEKYSRLSFGFTGPASDISDFFADVKKLVDDKISVGDRLEAIKNKRIANEKDKKIWMEKLCPNKNEKLLLETAGKIVWAKPTRKDYQSQAYCLLEPVVMEISNRLKIDTSTVWQMSISNMRKFLKGKYDSKLQTEFQKFYICVPKGPEKVEVLTGDKAHEFYDDNVLIEKNKIDVLDNVIKGNTACKGSARGIVKIINSKNDMSKMEVGNILVSVATSPSIVAAMKKASAIITDSGGLTCHAAIVSRELGIPCVIGTKIATQVLKDGDLVEVDADNGIVIILENESKGDNFEVKIGNQAFTPEFRSHPEVYFNYQAYPFFTSIFAKCYSHKETKWTTPCFYITEFNGDGHRAIQYCTGSFIEKGKNMINDLLSGGSEASKFLEKNNKLILNCFNECKKYLKNKNGNFLEIRDKIGTAFSEGWHIFNFSYAMQEYLNKLKIDNPDLFEKVSSNIMAPEKSFINQAEDYLIELCKKYPKNFDKVYEMFMEEYGRFQNSYLGINKKTTKSWLKEFYEKIKNNKDSNNKKLNKLADLPEKYKGLVETAGRAVCYQDNKKRLGSISYIIMENWLREISKEIKVSFVDLLWLTVEEILSYDLKSKTGIKRLKERISKYKNDNKRRGIMTNTGYVDIDENFRLEVVKLNNKGIDGNIIHGIIGNKGKISGRARIVLNIEKDAEKVNEGDILVTGMTRPEFVPIMRKAGAFVTDEGGVTCHAAIISRELGKPSIIGTKIATQVLKDGDLIEVDADNGIVKILESENNEIVKINKFSVNEFVYLMGKGKKSDIKIVEDFLNNSDWDVQRFNASPVFVNPTGMGNNYIFQKYFGISYSGFFFNYRGHQREMGYNLKDFHRLWAKLGNSYLHPGFVEEVAKDYYEIFSYFENIFNQIDNGLVIDENNIIEMLKIVNRAQCYSVGIAHSTELINYICSYELKPILEDAIGKEKFREIESKIFVADSLSFFAVEQNELYKIAMLKKGDEQDKLLREHLKKWNWILNSYVGAKELDVEFFVNRMEKVLHDGEIKLDLKQRDELIGFLSISEEHKNIIKLINYTTSRHDNRKANILKTIGYFEKILRILSNISKISFEDLLYLSFSDIDGLNSLKDLIDMEEELKQRRKGVIYILNDLKEYIYTKNDYVKLNGILEKLYAEQSTKELKGFVANKGYVKGKVRICNSMEKISKFKEGEILVASMTRPEYITAIKKCIAIITDEGGITCHAAIVSRELGKPCIIGTKIGTQVLNDGDLVEVDADNGVVRILESSN